MSALTKADIDLLLQSLEYTRQALEHYTYPSAALKAQRLTQVADVRVKLREMKRVAK